MNVSASLLEIKSSKFYSDSFRFNISIVRCLRGYFFWTQSILAITVTTARRSECSYDVVKSCDARAELVNANADVGQ